MKEGIIASFDPPWISAENLDYALILFKTSLLFFDNIIIDDSQIIDSAHFRYIASIDNFLSESEQMGRISFIKRKKTLDDLLEEVINRKPPMLFSSLDYIANDEIFNLGNEGTLTVERLFNIFRESDLRTGLESKVMEYEKYIELMNKLLLNSRIASYDRNYFSENFKVLYEKLFPNDNREFKSRTEVYNYIGTIIDNDAYKSELIKRGLKSLADLVYIFNKSYLIDGDAIYFIFDKRHFDEIDKNLKGIDISIDHVKSLYSKNINILKLEIYPITIDNEVSFFMNYIVPLSSIKKKDENFFSKLEKDLSTDKYLEQKLSFLKYISKREKYSSIVERKFPRFRSAMEILVLVFTLLSLSTELIALHGWNYLNIAFLIISIIVSVDGILGFIEFKSTKKLDTDFYKKIKNWYNDHKKKVEA